jgi:hypothetical protein
MRTVRLTRPAFINGALLDPGAVVEIDDHVALAPFMVEIQATPAPVIVPADPMPVQAVPVPDKAVTVHYDPATREIDIDVDGVSTRIDHATLKIETD